MTELSNQAAVDKAFADLDAAISEDTKNNEEIKELLTLPKKEQDKYALSIDVFGKTIRIRAIIPFEVRKQIIELQTKDFGDDFEKMKAADDMMYTVMADLCLDAPWTNQESWRYIDQQLGIAPRVWKDMILAIKTGEVTRKSFRRKR